MGTERREVHPLAPLALELYGITKAFGNNLAVDGVDFALEQGEIHALLGENGAGKSTLMNLIYGLHQPDDGAILIDGKRSLVDSPKTAIALGIGMVHQHFMLVPSLSVAENIALTAERGKFRFRRNEAAENVQQLSTRYGLSISPQMKVWNFQLGFSKGLRSSRHFQPLPESLSLTSRPRFYPHKRLQSYSSSSAVSNRMDIPLSSLVIS